MASTGGTTKYKPVDLIPLEQMLAPRDNRMSEEALRAYVSEVGGKPDPAANVQSLLSALDEMSRVVPNMISEEEARFAAFRKAHPNLSALDAARLYQAQGNIENIKGKAGSVGSLYATATGGQPFDVGQTASDVLNLTADPLLDLAMNRYVGPMSQALIPEGKTALHILEDMKPTQLHHGSRTAGIDTLRRSERGPLGPGVYATPHRPLAERYADEGGTVYSFEGPDKLFHGMKPWGAGSEVNPYEIWRNQAKAVVAAAPAEKQSEIAALFEKLGPDDGYPLYQRLANMLGSHEEAQALLRRAGYKGMTAYVDGPETVLFDDVLLTNPEKVLQLGNKMRTVDISPEGGAVTRIKLGAKPERTNNTEDFMDALWEQSDEHPFDRRSRILGDATVEVSPFEDAIHLSDIRSLAPKSGAGTAALKRLIEMADMYGVPIEGTAKAYHGDDRYIGSSKRLAKWYKKHGFEILGGSEDDGFDIRYIPGSREE